MSRSLSLAQQSLGDKKGKTEKKEQRTVTDWDKFGRTGGVQVLHIDLFYADGTKGEINVTSPYIIWSDDIETQYYHWREYLKSQHERLGVVGYRGHVHIANADGSFKKAWSWFPVDLVQNKTVEVYD